MIKIKDNIKKRLTVKLRQRFVIENEAAKQKKAYEDNLIDYKKTFRNYIQDLEDQTTDLLVQHGVKKEDVQKYFNI